MCWPKGKAKKNGHCHKIFTKAFDNYLAKEGHLQDLFPPNPRELSTLCIYIYLPESFWKPQGTCQSTKHRLSQLLPKNFTLQLWRNIPLTTTTLVVFCFGSHANGKKMHQISNNTWWGMKLKGIFLSNLWNLYLVYLLTSGKHADWCSPVKAIWVRQLRLRSCLTQMAVAWVSIPPCRVQG